MSDRLPLLSAQFAFAMEGQRTGRRASVGLQFAMPPRRLAARDADEVLQSVARTNPALAYRPRFARGEAYQEWCPAACDFGEIHAGSSDSATLSAAEFIAEFETALDGAPMAARLIRTPAGDRLVIVLDHALVDQQSLVLIIGQLAAPRQQAGDERSRFEAAVNSRHQFETAVGNESDVTFWTDRLGVRNGTFPQVRNGAATMVPAVTFPGVKIPRALRGSLFPYVLFSLHRAIRDSTPDGGASIIGYPWGGRDARITDLAGCFMNTAVSTDMTGPYPESEAVARFRDAWFEELGHIDVPFTSLIRHGSGFSGAVTAYLSYTHAWLSTVSIAGTEAVLVPPSHGEIPVTTTFQAAATMMDDELHPELFVDEELLGCDTEELGSRWCYWLDHAVSVSTTGESRSAST